MRRWPALLWLPVFVGSLFVLLGATGPDALLVAGSVLIGIACAYALYLAIRPSDREPRPPGARPALGIVGGFYLVAALVAGLSLGFEYALVALAAGAIPATAVTLLIALTRSKTAESGTLEDRSAEDREDSLPGIGADTRTPLGDTSELSDATQDPAAGADGRFARRPGVPDRP
jgi:hypothetical protein